MSFALALKAIQEDPRYLENLDWGKPRPGHPEAKIGAHIAELERNIDTLRPKLSDEEVVKLQLLVHTHDTFKPNAKRGVSIRDPNSHASLARSFLAEYVNDVDLLSMCQLHDEPYALWRQAHSKGRYNQSRFRALLNSIEDWDLFLAFILVDNCTVGKSREPVTWFFRELEGRIKSRFSTEDIA